MKYLHIMSADVKFVESTIRLFEYASPGNNFYLINGQPHAGLEGLANDSNTLFCDGFVKGNTYNNLPDFSEYKVIVIHDLCLSNALMADHLKKGKILLWLPWGGDVMSKYGYISTNPYQYHTAKLVRKFWLHRVKEAVRDTIVSLYHAVKLGPSPKTVYRRIFNLVNLVATPIYQDFELISQVPSFKGTYAGPFWYYLSDIKGVNREGNSALSSDIYLGNSAGPTSNHLDVLLKLQEIGVQDRKIIVPLSYNIPIEAYRTAIVETGKRFWGDNFVPLLNFMPRNEYASLIGRCGIAILNHEQQQAVGNAIILLFSGAKLFLSENSPVYKFLKQKGFLVFSVQKDLTSKGINTLLTEKEQLYNRELAIREFGEEQVKQVAVDLINAVNDYAGARMAEQR